MPYLQGHLQMKPYVFHRTMCTRTMTSLRHIECRITDHREGGPLELKTQSHHQGLISLVPYRIEMNCKRDFLLLTRSPSDREAALCLVCMQPYVVEAALAALCLDAEKVLQTSILQAPTQIIVLPLLQFASNTTNN